MTILKKKKILEMAKSNILARSETVMSIDDRDNTTLPLTDGPAPALGRAFSGVLDLEKKESEMVTSRFLTDFENIMPVAEGGFGQVFKATNKLDKNVYAIKKMILNYDNTENVKKLGLEVQTLSKLTHEHVVRYYQAWTEEICPEDLELIRKEEEE